MHEVSGLPCPGCGMTRSVIAWLRWDPVEAWSANPMSLLLIVGLILVLTSTILPAKPRDRFINAIAAFEVRTALVPLFGLLLIIAWIIRLSIVLLDRIN